jgi:hypothetical protein
MTTERSASAQPDREAGSTSTPGVATRVQGPADFQRTPHGSEGRASPLHPTPRTRSQIIMDWVRELPRASGERYFALRDCIQATVEGMEVEMEAQKVSFSEERSRLIACVPTTWLDPLLTGPDAVMGEPPWNCPEVEVLLRAIKKRMEETK